MKADGEKTNISFLLNMMEVKTSQLELVKESYDRLEVLEIDDRGNCPQETDVLALTVMLRDLGDDVQACIQHAKGRARVWRSHFDDSPMCDREIFELKLGALIKIRDYLWQVVCFSVRYMRQCQGDTKLFFEHRQRFEELELEIMGGLESRGALEAILATMTPKLKDLREAASLMDADCKRIQRRGFDCSKFEELLRAADASILKLENKLLVIQVESLKIDVESRNILCKICFVNDCNIRLVTVEGTCSHCLCSVCVESLEWKKDHWTDQDEYQRCPFCRERIVTHACLKLTFA